MRQRRSRPAVGLAVVAVLALAGCTGIGPRSIRVDQIDYADAIGDAAKRQVLLNVVKLRYDDYPTFVSVSQLVAGYQMQGQATLAATLQDLGSSAITVDNTANISVQGTFSDNPTVTYTPLVGADFAQTLLAPLAPQDLFGLMLAGVPLRLVFGIGLHSIGSYHNEIGGSLDSAGADPEFVELVTDLDRLRRAGWLIATLDPRDGRTAKTASGKVPADKNAKKDEDAGKASGDGKQIYVVIDRRNGDPDLLAAEQRVRKTLQLDATQTEFPLVFAMSPMLRPGEIRLRTRSLIEILGDLASAVDRPGQEGAAPVRSPIRLFAPDVHVRSSVLPPVDAFVSARYEGQWYFIGQEDERSKQLFTLVMLLFNLAESGKPLSLPVLTIATG
ncbi:MAG: hypothetical protein U1E45_21105 [Geminicoccaceae bacterium]